MERDSQTRRLLEELAKKPGHDEVKSWFGQLLVAEFGADLREIGFEKRVPEVCGRIDALIGRTVFEAKRDLDKERADVERKMPDYLSDRERETGEKFIGIASDGLNWAVYELRGKSLEKLKETRLDPDKGDQFLAWLDGALALKSSLPPEALTIRLELGGESVAFRRASQELLALWRETSGRPDLALKRQLWASMLKLVYGRDINDDMLWIQHSYLVIVAKSIALAVLDLKDDDPAQMLSGRAFEQANIHGAVESDFFDWVVASSQGERLVRRIMAHVRRFRLRDVQSDVLKILYESLIDSGQRHGLGEYYTPDWLAAKIVRHAVTAPHEQKVLDPACGSGTFLFHAVRNFLADAHDAGFDAETVAWEATELVMGTDIHPVAVIIARVTYLLALAPALAKRRGGVSIPVFLGDAMQLSIRPYFADKELKIRVPPPGQDVNIFSGNGADGDYLDFPDSFCRVPPLFDLAIRLMRDASEDKFTDEQFTETLRAETFRFFREQLGNNRARKEEPITDERLRGIEMLCRTWRTLEKLNREGRDSIWTYIARNLSRPLFFAANSGWASVVVGNPPWVAFRHMSADLQKRFKDMAKGERIYVGGKLTTQNDLSALFTVRCASLYVRPGGKIAFVLPLAALTRGQFEKFRSGVYESVRLRFDETWTMDDSVQPLFPVPSCVLFATKRKVHQQVHDKIARRAYSGMLPMRDAHEDVADANLNVTENAGDPAQASFEGGSVYREAFRQGATLVPRFLCFVERKSLGRLGADAGKPAVMSRRSPQEKTPWKSLAGIEGNVEAEFLRPVLLGESILPYRVFRPFEAVIPVTEKGVVLSSVLAAKRGHSGLANWMRQAEALWDANASEGNSMRLAERWDFQRELSAQFPITKLRVVYAASGKNPAACIVEDSVAAIEHKLYGGAFGERREAQFLCGIINSETTRSRIEHLQSKGQWGARDFDKVMFSLPIPRFDEKMRCTANWPKRRPRPGRSRRRSPCPNPSSSSAPASWCATRSPSPDWRSASTAWLRVCSRPNDACDRPDRRASKKMRNTFFRFPMISTTCRIASPRF